MAEEIDTCPSCGAQRTGLYCGHCGEKRLEPQDRGLRTLVATAASNVFETDGRLPRSLYALLFKPGVLSSDWMAGRRTPWLSPVSMFLLINVMVFLAPPLSDFNLSLREQVEYQPWGDIAGE